ncbi:hypothetical protein A143_17630 [Vibrio splendidus ZS-139]|nr:hypothetical protein A143_17630 [Vibrio splendidus ZS-139]
MRIFKFGSVGFVNTVLSYSIFALLIYLNVHYLVASSLSFFVGTMFSYVINSQYTFSVQSNVRGFIKFFLITLASLTVSLLLLYIFKSKFSTPVLLAQLLVVLVRFPFVYLLMKYVVFNRIRTY